MTDNGLATSRPARQPTPGVGPFGMLGLCEIVVCVLLLASLLLMFRRIAGGLTVPPSPLVLVTAAVIFAGCSLGARIVTSGAGGARRRPVMWGTACAAVAAGIALTTVPGTSLPAVLSFWAIVSTGEIIKHWKSATAPGWAAAWWNNPPAQGGSGVTLHSDPAHGVHELMVPEATLPGDHDESLADSATQRILRFDSPDGGEMIVATLRCRFQPGQRSNALHVAFCPPLEKILEAEVAQIAGPEAGLKIAQRLPQGLRVEARLQEAPLEPTSIVVEVVARECEAKL